MVEPYLPEHIRDGLANYLTYGIEPGSFLSAVICNNLSEAVGRADHINIRHLPEIVCYFYNNVPRAAWGSQEKMDAWMERKQQQEAVDDGG